MIEIIERLKHLGAETEDTLERFMGDKDMYVRYIKGFPEEPTMPALINAVKERDYSAAKNYVHAFKGIANNLGFLPLADLASDMLEALRGENIIDALNAYDDLKKQYELYTMAILKWGRTQDKGNTLK